MDWPQIETHYYLQNTKVLVTLVLKQTSWLHRLREVQRLL